MMVSLGARLRRWQRLVRHLAANERVREAVRGASCVALGFAAGAASLLHYPQPVALALVCASGGMTAILLTAGAMGGYLLFWGRAGAQCVVWLMAGMLAAVFLGDRPIRRSSSYLMAALAGLIVSSCGLLFQLWQGDGTPVTMYLLRIALAAGLTMLFDRAQRRRDPVTDWMLGAVGVLALAQIGITPYLNLGCVAAGVLSCAGAFPAAALAGLALDLAGITRVSMTAVMTGAFLVRLLPWGRRKWMNAAPAAVYLLVMALSGVWDLRPLPGLILGGAGALLVSARPGLSRRRGETGIAQVRIELVASVLDLTGQLLREIREPPVDEAALILRAADRACNGCPCRKTCKLDVSALPTGLLHKPLGDGGDLPQYCRKSGRLLRELRRGQEQLRSIRADRDRRSEYRWAVVEQYQFLSEYLRSLSDDISRKKEPPESWYQPEIAVCSASKERSNGDRCLWFAGTRCRYYIVLCDGMGTGEEAAREGRLNGEILRKLLSAGYPAQYALRMVNSLCALQGRAGAVTVDLAELELDTGKACLYKWGAAASFVISRGEPVRVGSVTPPPGLSVTEGKESVEKVSLRRGETLILLSDGAGGEESLRRAWERSGEPAGELASQILECGGDGSDDATVAVVRLRRTAVTVS